MLFQGEEAVTKSSFVILAFDDQAPVVLGPMSEEMRTQHMRELRRQYGPNCGLHELDVTARSATKVSVKVKR